MRHCPICHTPARAYSIGVRQYRIFKCAECGLEWTDPVPSEQELRKFYATYRDERADKRVSLRNARRNLDWLESMKLEGGASMLEFGYGNGAFKEVSKCCGVEINESLLFRGYKTIVMWGVLEHLPNPVQTLRTLSGRLMLGGKLALTTVDAESEIPYHYKPPEHLTYWTRASMRWLAIQASLEMVSYEPYEMEQLSVVYTDRLFARTPEQYKPQSTWMEEFVTVPTNECRVLMRKI